MSSIEDRIVLCYVSKDRGLAESRRIVWFFGLGLGLGLLLGFVVEEDWCFELRLEEFLFLDVFLFILLLFLVGTLVVADDGSLVPLAGAHWLVRFLLGLLRGLL